MDMWDVVQGLCSLGLIVGCFMFFARSFKKDQPDQEIDEYVSEVEEDMKHLR